MKPLPIVVLGWLLFSPQLPLLAATITVGPSDCSAATVNSAIASASAGSTIRLTCSGTITWTTQVALSGGKTLFGPGIFDPADAINHGTWPLVVNSTATGTAMIVITNANGQAVNRLTGLKIGGSGAQYGIAILGRGTGSGAGAFRMDNMYIDNPSVSSRIVTVDGSTGALTGLVDHNYFYDPTSSLMNSLQSWRGASSTCYGYDSLSRPVTWGASDFVFYEDNIFWNVGIDSGGEGTRYVIRFNRFDSDQNGNQLNPVDGHGADQLGHHDCGTVAGEIYGNTVAGTGKSYAQFVHARGGKWLIYDNSVRNGSILLNEQRVGLACSTQLDWKACAGNDCCPAACKQCPTAADFSTCYPLPNQISSTYIWNNNGGSLTPTVLNEGAVQTYIAAGRDFFTTPYAYTRYPYPHPLAVPPATPTGLKVVP